MIVVDQLQTYTGRGRLSGQWCHMLSDTGDMDELHAMARRLELKRSWFQDDGQAWGRHYDLRPTKRALAVELGAREITFREMGELLLQLREAEAETETSNAG